MKTKTITLTEKQLKLLMIVLAECEETRSDMGCNDPYEEEEKLFTEEERIEINKNLRDEEDAEELDDFLYNSDYVQYLINIIGKQTK